jgi:hypothetical protein
MRALIRLGSPPRARQRDAKLLSQRLWPNTKHMKSYNATKQRATFAPRLASVQGGEEMVSRLATLARHRVGETVLVARVCGGGAVLAVGVA